MPDLCANFIQKSLYCYKSIVLGTYLRTTAAIMIGATCILVTPLQDNPVLEITVGHWPFSNQFQRLADQNPFWSANFTNGMAINNKISYLQMNSRPFSDPYFYH